MKGPFLLLLTTIFYAISHSLVKSLGADLHVAQLAFVRFISAPIILIPWFWVMKKQFHLHSWPLLSLRTLFGISGMLLYFWALIIGDPGKVSLIFQTSSIWAILLSSLLFKDKLSRNSLLSIPITFIGLTLITLPEFGNTTLFADSLALIASLLNTGVYLSLKALRQNSSSDAIMLANYSISSVILAIPCFSMSMPVFSPPIIISLLLISTIGFLGNFLMTIGFKYTSASIASVMMTLTVPWMYISGLLFFQETVTLVSLVGAILVFSSVAYISYQR
tara:strand:- start:115 stop:945 length:831 start_codon:yes stop_codon:yes gene_type:complete